MKVDRSNNRGIHIEEDTPESNSSFEKIVQKVDIKQGKLFNKVVFIDNYL